MTGLISLLSKGLSRVYSNTIQFECIILWCSAFFMVQLSHLYRTIGKTVALTRWTFVSKVMCLLFIYLFILTSVLILFFFFLNFILFNFTILYWFCFLICYHSFSSKEQTSFNFMAAVTICSDFGAQESLSLFPLFLHLFAMK